jgi:hypothetical protein
MGGGHLRGQDNSVQISPATVMRRAWAIFSETYGYPRMPFRSIGRACFAWALRKAWAEVRSAAELAAIPTADIAARVQRIETEIASLTYADWGVSVSEESPRLQAELRPLIAELGRRPVAETLILSLAA